MSKKVISLLLAVMLTAAMIVVAAISVSADTDDEGSYVPSEGTETYHIYFCLFRSIAVFTVTVIVEPLTGKNQFILIVLGSKFRIDNINHIVKAFNTVGIIIRLAFIITLKINIGCSISKFIFRICRIVCTFKSVVPDYFINIGRYIRTVNIFDISIAS